MLSIWRAAVEQFDLGRDFVLATILSVRGSSPRHLGTRFLVRFDGSIVGTIGGGLFEANVKQFAICALQTSTSHRLVFAFHGNDSQSTEMICGGDAEVLVEFVNVGNKVQEKIFRHMLEISKERISGYLLTPICMSVGGNSDLPLDHLLIDDKGTRIGGFIDEDKALKAIPEARLLRPVQLLEEPGFEHPVFLEWLHPKGTVYIFGAGHVGECVAHLAAYVDFRVVVIDDRSEFANHQRIPDADDVLAIESFDQAFFRLNVDEDSFIVIVTRGHAHDRIVLAQALRSKAGYIGMIGSRRKTAIIYQALLTEGFSQGDLMRCHAPIGLPIGGESPQEIGVSIVGEMISARNRKDQLKRRGE
ncbi:MAG: XdhC family aldehyde oxidoreductase maturation factor [Desulfomonile sp.]